MAVTEKDLKIDYIKEIKIGDIKCKCENKEEILKAINNAIRTVNDEIAVVPLYDEKIVAKRGEIQAKLMDKISKKYPGLDGTFMKAEVDIKYEMLKILTPYTNEILKNFKTLLKTWISNSSKGVTPEFINDAVKCCKENQGKSTGEYIQTLEDKSNKLIDQIIGTYQKDFDKMINRKLSQVQTELKNEIQTLQNWVPVWNPADDFSNLLNALKELLKVTKSGKGLLTKEQIGSIDKLLQEWCKGGNNIGYMETISKNSLAIKGITDQETKRIVISYMNMVAEKSTEKQNFAKSYIESKFRLTIKRDQELLKKLIQQLTSIIEKSIDTSVTTNLTNLCGAILRLINIISPQPMKGKLDQNDITLIKQLILCTYKNYKFTNKIPEINLLCVEDMPTKCLMLDIIKLVEQNNLNDSDLKSIADNYLKSKNSITQKDLKIGIFNMPSTKKKLVEDINEQIKRFDKFIKKQKSEIIKQRDEKIENLTSLQGREYESDLALEEVKNTAIENFDKDMQQHISKLKEAFKTKYLNKWIKNKKAFETDCVIKNDVCKWEQGLINSFPPKFVEQALEPFDNEIQYRKKIYSHSKDVNQKINSLLESIKETAVKEFDNYVETNDIDNISVLSATQRQEIGKIDQYLRKQYTSQLKNAFKTDYLNKWTKNKKDFETDCNVVKDDLCKWQQDLIAQIEPKFLTWFENNLKNKLKEAAIKKYCDIAKYVSDAINPYIEVCLGMLSLLEKNPYLLRGCSEKNVIFRIFHSGYTNK